MAEPSNPKSILLISNSSRHKEVFDKLCEKKEFVICDIIDQLDQVLSNLASNTYDLIIASSEINNHDVVKFFYENQIHIDKDIPVIFILQEEASMREMRFFESLKISLLYEDYLDVNFLNYSLKTALQKHKLTSLLKENELRYRSLYDHSLDINLIFDLDYTVIDANVQGRKVLDFQNSFALKKIFQDKQAYEKFYNLLNEVEQVSRFETILKLKAKKAVCLLDAFTLYDGNNERVGAHLVIRNVDESRKSQNIANQASKLLVTGKFLRSLAHEIRNPLTNINLALEQIGQENMLEEDSRLYVDVVQRSADRIKDLLEEIMNAYKTSQLSFQEESLHNIIENSLMFANDRLMLKNIRLDLKFKAKKDQLSADKIKLTTAVLNLIVNASEAITHDHGEISIATEKKGNNLILEIKDNGCGMNEDQTKALFDPFYTGKSKGLGLGLTTAQNVIFAHKGSIEVKSKVNKGTSFLITLPRKA